MDTKKLAQLRPSTRKQYCRAISKLCEVYSGDLTPVGIQTHVNDVGICLYTRILRTLFKNFFHVPGNICMIKKPKAAVETSYLSFVPNYVHQHKYFSQFECQLRSYIDVCQPEPRKQTNIRYEVSVLWGLLQHTPHLTEAKEGDLLLAIAHVCKQQMRTSVKPQFVSKMTHAVRTLNKYLSIAGRPGVTVARAGNFLRAHLDTNMLIRYNEAWTDSIKQQIPPQSHTKTLSVQQVDRMKTCQKSSRDNAIFILMLETGLRRRAVAWMTLESISDGTQIHSVGYATEKGLCVRYFPISDGLKDALHQYLSARSGAGNSKWLFPCKGDASNHISPSTVRNVIQRICRLSYIPPHLSHCHAIRRFVVCELMRAGNNIEQVSKWLGHRSTDTTYHHYWHIQLRDLQQQMTIPWQ